MAWTDQCKISAVQTIKKVAEDKGVPVRKAIAEVSKEADIPAATLQRWYYPRSKNEVKSDLTFQRRKDEDRLLNTVDQIRERRLRAAIIHAAYEFVEEKCLEGCSIDPEFCIIRKYIDFLEARA